MAGLPRRSLGRPIVATHAVALKSHAGLNPLAPEAAFILAGVKRRAPFADSIAVAFEDCTPVRAFASWPGKRNYSGHYWSSTTRRHVGFESLFERTALMTLDRDRSLVGISSQPMWIRWPTGCTPSSHAPDYFVRHRNGDGEIIDVRPESLIDRATAAVFDATRRLCGEVGFLYTVVSEMDRELDRNLKFLSRYRGDVWALSAAELDRLGGGGVCVSVRDLAEKLSPHADLSRGLGCVYWLIWRNIVDVDLARPLSLQSQLTLRTEVDLWPSV